MPLLAKFQNVMICLIQFKLDFVCALFLKFRKVNAFLVKNLVFVFSIELYDAYSKVVRV